MASDLLLELGTEEIPAGELDRALGELPAYFVTDILQTIAGFYCFNHGDGFSTIPLPNNNPGIHKNAD